MVWVTSWLWSTWVHCFLPFFVINPMVGLEENVSKLMKSVKLVLVAYFMCQSSFWWRLARFPLVCGKESYLQNICVLLYNIHMHTHTHTLFSLLLLVIFKYLFICVRGWHTLKKFISFTENIFFKYNISKSYFLVMLTCVPLPDSYNSI